MNTFVLHKWDDECKKVTFYTITFDSKSKTETDEFFEKYVKTHKEEISYLNSLLLEEIGNRYGAHEALCNRHENDAIAFPPKISKLLRQIGIYDEGFELRLFAMKITENIVVLFNGGIKSSQFVQDSPDLSIKFYETMKIVATIDRAIKERYIRVSEDSRIIECDDSEIVMTF